MSFQSTWSRAQSVGVKDGVLHENIEPHLPSQSQSWKLFLMLDKASSHLEEICTASDLSVAALTSEIVHRLNLKCAGFDARLHRAIRDAKGNLTGIDPAPLPALDELRSCGLSPRDTVALRLVNALDLHHFDNVVVAPPCHNQDRAMHDVARATVLNPAAGMEARVAALSSIAADVLGSLASSPHHAPGALASLALPLMHTEAHCELLQTLLDYAADLAGKRCKGSNGGVHVTLTGVRGSGKTVMLQAFSLACNVVFPRVIPVYVTGRATLGSCFKPHDLLQVLIAAARAHGIVVDHVSSLAALTRALQEKDCRVLLIVDAIDQLYETTDADAELRRNVLESLGLLNALGDSADGVFSVILCGASSSTYQLICRTDVERLQHRFPLVRHTHDMNSTKYGFLHIPSASCNDSAQVLHVADILQLFPQVCAAGDRRQLARIINFIGGTTPRAVKAVAKALLPELRPPMRTETALARPVVAGSLLIPERVDQVAHRVLRSKASLVCAVSEGPSALLLYNEAMQLLINANGPLLDRLRTPGAIARCNLQELVRDMPLDAAPPCTGTASLTASTSIGAAGDVESCSSAHSDDRAVRWASLTWEQLVTPVRLADVRAAWPGGIVTAPKPQSAPHNWGRRQSQAHSATGVFESLLDSLIGASLLAVRQDPTSSGAHVWPVSAAQLVYHDAM